MFSSSFLKIERANQHIDQLETIFRSFIKDNPHRIFIQPDAKTGQIRVGVEFDQPLPLHISTITGDAIHNLRTSLDHLACTLVRTNGGTVTRNTGFLTHEDRGSFESNFEKRIEGASNEAVQLTKSMEPYNGGKGTALWRLNKLDVADKHHSLILTARITVLPTIIVRNPDGSILATLTDNRVGGDGRINLMAVPSGCAFEIENEDQSLISILFRNTDVLQGKDVIVSLKKLPDIVLDTVQTFDQKFRTGVATS